jgi:hypothetical protein
MGDDIKIKGENVVVVHQKLSSRDLSRDLLNINFLKLKFNEMNKKFVYSINETMIRNKIITQVIIKYYELKEKLKKNDPLYEQKKKFYRPDYFFTFYIIFVPFFFLNFNLFFLWRLRRDISFLKYVTLFMFNFFSLFMLFSYTDKWIFFEYIKKPRPYSNYMREEFLKEKENISEASFNKVNKIHKELKEIYNF